MQSTDVIERFISIIGKDNVATQPQKTEHYRKGWRSGEGEALAVLFPQTLLACWQLLEVCVEANCIIIMQAAKTGLTEGSTPNGDDYDRPVVIINTLAMDDIILLNEGKHIISFPGATLHKLESMLKPLKRAPHSVIGSSCLGASIVGGIANNSGGALVKRGPAYTELSLFAQVDKFGKLHLVNHLGIALGETPEEIFTNLARGNFEKNDYKPTGKGSASDYESIVRDVDADTPSRYNADPSRLFEASGCAGKIAVFAVVLDTFPMPEQEQTFYIGTNDAKSLTALRHHMLKHFSNLPEVGEYLHRDMFDIADKYGKDTFLSIYHLGTTFLPKLFSAKGRIDAVLNKVSFLPPYLSDRVMQGISALFPDHLPKRIRQFRNKYEHHLILKVSDEGIEEAKACLKTFFSPEENRGEYIQCTEDEAQKAFLLRFAAAGAAVRYQTLKANSVGEILALDIALRRNDEQWVEVLPSHISEHIDQSLYYGHFFCHVFHQDYVLKKSADAKKVKKDMLALLDARGAKYPAEHNVGHLYEAEEALVKFYKTLDPTNSFNPGVGGMEKHKRNCSCC